MRRCFPIRGWRSRAARGGECGGVGDFAAVWGGGRGGGVGIVLGKW